MASLQPFNVNRQNIRSGRASLAPSVGGAGQVLQKVGAAGVKIATALALEQKKIQADEASYNAKEAITRKSGEVFKELQTNVGEDGLVPLNGKRVRLTEAYTSTMDKVYKGQLDSMPTDLATSQFHSKIDGVHLQNKILADNVSFKVERDSKVTGLELQGKQLSNEAIDDSSMNLAKGNVILERQAEKAALSKGSYFNDSESEALNTPIRSQIAKSIVESTLHTATQTGDLRDFADMIDARGFWNKLGPEEREELITVLQDARIDAKAAKDGSLIIDGKEFISLGKPKKINGVMVQEKTKAHNKYDMAPIGIEGHVSAKQKNLVKEALTPEQRDGYFHTLLRKFKEKKNKLPGEVVEKVRNMNFALLNNITNPNDMNTVSDINVLTRTMDQLVENNLMSENEAAKLKHDLSGSVRASQYMQTSAFNTVQGTEAEQMAQIDSLFKKGNGKKYDSSLSPQLELSVRNKLKAQVQQQRKEMMKDVASYAVSKDLGVNRSWEKFQGSIGKPSSNKEYNSYKNSLMKYKVDRGILPFGGSELPKGFIEPFINSFNDNVSRLHTSSNKEVSSQSISKAVGSLKDLQNAFGGDFEGLVNSMETRKGVQMKKGYLSLLHMDLNSPQGERNAADLMIDLQGKAANITLIGDDDKIDNIHQGLVEELAHVETAIQGSMMDRVSSMTRSDIRELIISNVVGKVSRGAEANSETYRESINKVLSSYHITEGDNPIIFRKSILDRAHVSPEQMNEFAKRFNAEDIFEGVEGKIKLDKSITDNFKSSANPSRKALETLPIKLRPNLNGNFTPMIITPDGGEIPVTATDRSGKEVAAEIKPQVIPKLLKRKKEEGIFDTIEGWF